MGFFQRMAAAADQQPITKQKGILKWLPLFIMSLALTTIMLDGNIFSVTMRNIALDLHASLQGLEWVITISSLVLATFTITGGRLGDLFGRKKMFILGTAIFVIGSFMTSVAGNVGWLVFGNAVVEGIGGCLMIPATMSLLRSYYQGRDRQVAFGIWGAVLAGAAAVGSVIGGWFTTHYNWRWAFRANVIIGIGVVLAALLLQEYRDLKERPTIDVVGVILSALGMLGLVFGFIESTTLGWWRQKTPLMAFGHQFNLAGLSPVPIFIALGLTLLGAFLLWEARMERQGRTPLVSLGLFRNKTFMAGTGVSTMLGLGQACLNLFVPVYLQAVLKLDPIHTGLSMIPMTAVVLVAAPFSAQVSKFLEPKRIIQLGIVLDAIGLLVLRQSLQVSTGIWALAPGFALLGLGAGLMLAQAGNLSLSAIAVEQAGEASGVANAIGSLGQSLGAAVMGAVLLSSMALHISTGIQNSRIIPQNDKPAITQNLASRSSDMALGETTHADKNLPAASSSELRSITDRAAVLGNKSAIAYGAIITLLALTISTQLPDGSNVEAVSPVAREVGQSASNDGAPGNSHTSNKNFDSRRLAGNWHSG